MLQLARLPFRERLDLKIPLRGPPKRRGRLLDSISRAISAPGARPVIMRFSRAKYTADNGFPF